MSPSDMALFIINKIEGGYVDDKRDKGGATKYGVSVKSHPDLRGRIKDLTKEEAAAIYVKEYYEAAKIGEYPEKVRLVVLDFAINHGVPRSKKFVQKALKKLGFKLEVDGIVGPITIAAMSKVDCLEFITVFSRLRQDFFRKLKDYEWAGESWERRTILVAAAT